MSSDSSHNQNHLDDSDTPKRRPLKQSETKTPIAETAKPDQAGTTSAGETTETKAEREFGRLPFQPQCAVCSTRLGCDVRMVQTRADGPIATYQCPECKNRIKTGRPWQQKPPIGQAPNVAARPDMK